MKPSEAVGTLWDVIVVGTGMGGATLGYALARAGRTVLFCEKGKSLLASPHRIGGAFAEMYFPRPEAPQPKHSDVLANAGRYREQLVDLSQTRARSFIPFIGSGTGGSSALYGMAMERFFPVDFTPGLCYPDAGDSTLPERWPVSYAELEPYYRAAEDLYRVRGDADPLRETPAQAPARRPPAFSSVGSELVHFFRSKGLHPYRLPMACEFVPGCRCCQGYLCDLGCKNDSGRMCVQPALSQFGARLLDECDVLRLEATRTEVTSVVCTWGGRELKLRGRIVALGAGALESPCILLRSTSGSWPNGLANDSGLVGRNLMRHHVNLYLLSPGSAAEPDLRQKEIGFNDFYYADGRKLGTVQSFGALPPASVLAAAMRDDLRGGRFAWAAALLRLVHPLVAQALKRMLSRQAVLATQMEDLPYADNLVRPFAAATGKTGPRIAISYRTRSSEAARGRTFRALMADILKPYRSTLIKQAENNQLLAHACGTCRFGVDPRKSVLDRDNRAHGLANLYVVDSSFFPSSAGTNPSLTIAANALRVAAHLGATAQ